MSASAPASVIDRTNALDPAVVAAQFEDFVHHRAVFAFQLARLAGGRPHVGTGLVVDPQHAVLIGRCAAEGGAMRPVSETASPRPGSRRRSDTSATTPALAYVLSRRGTSSMRSSAAIDLQRDRHPRKHDRVIQGTILSLSMMKPPAAVARATHSRSRAWTRFVTRDFRCHPTRQRQRGCDQLRRPEPGQAKKRVD